MVNRIARSARVLQLGLLILVSVPAGIVESASGSTAAGCPLIGDGERAGAPTSLHDFLTFGQGFAAQNHGQRWLMLFDGRGFLLDPLGADWSWGLELQSYGLDGSEQEVTQPLQSEACGPTLTYVWAEGFEEWFVNDGRGLEHGFTLTERPEGLRDADDSKFIIKLAIRGDLIPSTTSDRRGLLFADAREQSCVAYTGLVAFDADGKELEAELTLRDGEPRLAVELSGARYPVTIDPVAHQAYIKASNTGAVDFFGSSIAVSGNTLVIGAGGEGSASAGVDADQSDNSAESAGAVYVFVRGQGAWSQQVYIKASNAEAYDSFGVRVSTSGDTLVVGAPGESSAATGVDGDASDNSAQSSGAAYVFVRSQGGWSEQAFLKASNTAVGDNFGYAVAVSGDTVVVSAREEGSSSVGVDGAQSNDDAPSSGAAYVFVRSGTSWSQQAYLKASNTGAGDFFGWSVAAHEDRVVIGAPHEDSPAQPAGGGPNGNSVESNGAVYVFARQGSSWEQEAVLKPVVPALGQEFGRSVAIAGDTIVVGTSDHGAHVFVESAGTWILEQILVPAVIDAADGVGYSVALDGDSIVVGAPFEDSGATGVGGDPRDDRVHSAGAAYLFLRSAGVWNEAAFLKASNTMADQFFGGSLAVSDGVVVTSAMDDSAAVGLNGDASDTSALAAGAAHAFDIPTTGIDAFCFGDSSGATCPCFNFSSAGAGCQNSSGAGAMLESSGFACVGADLLSLHMTGSVVGAPGLLMQGSIAIGAGAPLGNGLLCLVPQRQWPVRTGDNSGSVTYGPGLLSMDPSVFPGATVLYQWWYRDTANTCGNGFNYSNGLSVTWQ